MASLGDDESTTQISDTTSVQSIGLQTSNSVLDQMRVELQRQAGVALRKCAEGTSSGRAKDKKKKTAKAPAFSMRAFEPPHGHKVKVPKGTNAESDLVRAELLLSGWGCPGCWALTDPMTGRNALHFAARAGRGAMIELLLRKGATLNAKDDEGRTEIYLSALNGNTDCASSLIENGADFTIPNKYGNTPLHAACRNERIEVLDLLISMGADINAPNNGRLTPLILCKDPVVKSYVQNKYREVQQKREKRVAQGLPEFELVDEYRQRTAKKDTKNKLLELIKYQQKKNPPKTKGKGKKK